MDNLEIGQWPLNVSRVSLLRFVLLINMLISGVVIKMFYLGKGGGGERKKGPKKREGGGRSKETKKIINQFAHKSDPAIIPFSPGGGCCGYVGSSL